MNFQKVCILGLGYIGLPTACTLANNGIAVVGVDVKPEIINGLQNGQLHIYEPGLDELVKDAVDSGRLIVRNAPEAADAFIIAVPTPFYDDKRADMRAVTSAAESIVPVLKRGDLVVLESTSPPRTTVDLVAPILERSGLKAGSDFYLAYSPERVLPGKIIHELVENARVIGGINPESAEAGRDLYRTFVRGEIFITEATTAEMVKLMENTYRDVNIAIANEFSRLADRLEVDVWDAIQLANRHPRVKILNPGAGVGGHCISVDPWFLVEAAPDLTPLIRTARHVNDSQPGFVVALTRRTLGHLAGKRIAALGLSFKPDVDDLRESPAVEVAHLLTQAGASVRAYEPYKPDAKIAGLNTDHRLAAVVEDADALLLLVAHKPLRELDPFVINQLTRARIVIDAAGGWEARTWQQAGFHYYRLGTGSQERRA